MLIAFYVLVHFCYILFTILPLCVVADELMFVQNHIVVCKNRLIFICVFFLRKFYSILDLSFINFNLFIFWEKVAICHILYLNDAFCFEDICLFFAANPMFPNGWLHACRKTKVDCFDHKSLDYYKIVVAMLRICASLTSKQFNTYLSANRRIFI